MVIWLFDISVPITKVMQLGIFQVGIFSILVLTAIKRNNISFLKAEKHVNGTELFIS
jgi:hypothetical protein